MQLPACRPADLSGSSLLSAPRHSAATTAAAAADQALDDEMERHLLGESLGRLCCLCASPKMVC